MDARITKQRLGNLISYDWLKMLATIAIFVLVLILLFTMTATRPRKDQEYGIYAYTDLTATTAFSGLGDTLLKDNAFSYDILAVTAESFAGNNYASSIYSARRAAGQGTVMFLTDVPVYKEDEEGNTVLEDGEPVIETPSSLYSFASGSAVDGERPSATGVYDTVYYMQLCEEYLASFFGTDWAESDAFDGERTIEESFSRNDGDKRYRSAEARAEGLEEERARLLKLRTDYLAVRQAFGDGTFSHTAYEETEKDANGDPLLDDSGNEVTYTQNLGINVGELAGLKKLLYYLDDDGKQTTQAVNLCILYNNYLDGHDLCFETVSFLNWLLEEYN